MKKYLFFVLIIFISSLGFAQEVEKIFETDEVKYKSREPARLGPLCTFMKSQEVFTD